MTPATAILVPVLNRPQNVRPLVESVEAATPEPHEIVFLIEKPPSDHDEYAAILDVCNGREAKTNGRISARWCEPPGTWARKINLGFRVTTEPFVFLAADDLRFHHGWLTEALRVMHELPPVMLIPETCVVGTNDLGNQRTYDHAVAGYPHSTHSLVRRSYIDEQGGTMDKGPGVVLCEEYPHEYADDELVETAKTRVVYAHADRSVVEHLHPIYGKAQHDGTYALGQSRTRDARRIFQRRAAELGFGTPSHHALASRSSRDAGELGRRASRGQ